MSTNHILNCMNKIMRDNWRTEYLDYFKEELNERMSK